MDVKYRTAIDVSWLQREGGVEGEWVAYKATFPFSDCYAYWAVPVYYCAVRHFGNWESKPR